MCIRDSRGTVPGAAVRDERAAEQHQKAAGSQHAERGDGPAEMAPAVVVAALVADYLVAALTAA